MPIDAGALAGRLTKANADRAAIEPFSAEIPGFDLAAGPPSQQRAWRTQACALGTSCCRAAWLPPFR